MVMWGRSVNVTTLFMDRFRPPKQLTSTKAHILSPLSLLESAEEETKVRCRTGYRTSDLWRISETLSMTVYATFQYCLSAFFASNQRFANISENFTCSVFPNFVLCSRFLIMGL